MPRETSKDYDLVFADGATVLTIHIDEEEHFAHKYEELAEAIVTECDSIAQDHRQAMCLVIIKARAATSQLIRILYQVYRACQKQKSRLYVTGYPREYMLALTT